MTYPSSAGRASFRQARVAGVCYILVIAGGVFAALFVRGALYVPGDPGATAAAIAANETLWRWGMAVHACYLIAGAAFGVILYQLFKSVHPTLALLALVLSIVPVAIEAALLTGLYVPLFLLDGGDATGFPGEAQRQALGYLAVRLFLFGWNFSLLLFGGFCVLIGWLIWRSRLVPRLIGALMVTAGLSYLVNSLAGIVSPSFSHALQPFILLPPFIGESSLAFWLLVKGIRTSDRVIA